MDYDIAVIGAGWAGYNASLRARDLGLKTLLVEKADIGGTCLNRGCIPTKALIQSAKVNNLINKSKLFGIIASQSQVDFQKVQEHKDKIVQQLRSGMKLMLKGIDYLQAEEAVFNSPEELRIGSRNITAASVIVASGSMPVELSGLPFDGKKILSSDDILNLTQIPSNLLIIGGGVIGCEFACLFSNLGSKVTIVELTPQLLPGVDNQAALKLSGCFKKKSITVNTNTDVRKFDFSGFERVLVCVGRRPCVDRMGLDKIGVSVSKKGIFVDERLKTNIPGIYAAGDCTGRILLAHYAAYQGRIAAGNIAHPDSLEEAENYNIPNCIFTDPEISSVGLSEHEAQNKGFEVAVNRFDFLGSGMARILEETDGFIKIISDKKTEELLGAVIIGPRATELIGILTVAISNKLKMPQIRKTIFPHPTLSEAIGEAF